ncbi:MAG TPA: nuclear transport factor 2 family protein [Ktedonosporobacter sp.]|nr:nuclear transport factor 2 family protein [Ktedonosporobacter sp.]
MDTNSDNIMDTNSDIVKLFMNALEINDFEVAADYLADNFIFSGWTPLPLYKKDFMAVIQGLKEGFPGLMFNLHNVQEADNGVTGTIQVAGYQTDSFILPSLGLPPIPQMARSVSLPTEEVEYLLRDGKIEVMSVEPVKEGGIKGILHQLGVDVPIVQ